MSPITRETLAARIAALEAEKDISIKEAFYLKTMRLLLAEIDKPQPHHNGMMKLSNELADAKAALRRLSMYARTVAGDIQYTGDHPIAVAEKLAGRQWFGNTEPLDTAPAQFESLAGEPVTIKANGGGYENDEPPERGWVVTHSGKDYFYREQGDAATHMNAAVESGRKVSLRSFIPETVTAAYKSPDSWMACRDHNPEKGRHLALFGKRTKENCDPYVDEGYLGSDGEFYFFDWEGGPRINDCHPYDKAEVTHWMYRDLPAAPQQEVNNGN